MLNSYSFHIEQLLSLKGAATQIATFRPNGKTPADIQTMVTNAQTVQSAWLEKRTLREGGRAELRASHEGGHQAAVMVYAILKASYGEDAKTRDFIRRLPKGDATASQTLTRMEATSKLWAELPNPPGQSTAFVAGTMTKLAFDALWTDLKTKFSECVDCEQQYQMTAGDLQELDGVNVRFISAALAQGRAQFRDGTAERVVIDAVPTESNTPLPGQALITEAESNMAGEVHLLYEAPNATRYSIWHKGPTDTVFTELVEETQGISYDPVNVSPGGHQYKVVGWNSRGSGPASEPVAIQVAGAAAA